MILLYITKIFFYSPNGWFVSCYVLISEKLELGILVFTYYWMHYRFYMNVFFLVCWELIKKQKVLLFSSSLRVTELSWSSSFFEWLYSQLRLQCGTVSIVWMLSWICFEGATCSHLPTWNQQKLELSFPQMWR